MRTRQLLDFDSLTMYAYASFAISLLIVSVSRISDFALGQQQSDTRQLFWRVI